jgi:glutathione synthase
MKIAFVVNDLQTRKATHATIRLAQVAHNRGHETWLTSVANLSCDQGGEVRAQSIAAPKETYRTTDAYVRDLLSKNAKKERVALSEFDVVMLRNNPAAEVKTRSWGQYVGIFFGRLLVSHGVIVVNDPEGQARGLNKIYLQEFPKIVRPQTLITRERSDVKSFVQKYDRVVVKPLQGSGGQGVFLLRKEDKANINQIVDTITASGYLICQEYLPEAEQGDTRLLMLNGEPLKHRGRHAAFRRCRSGGDIRSNVHAGGTVEPVEVDGKMLEVTRIVGPKLKHDGMFFVGLDIVGEKILEINIFSPGGLENAQKVTSVNFTGVVIDALQRKVSSKRLYGGRLSNQELSVL